MSKQNQLWIAELREGSPIFIDELAQSVYPCYVHDNSSVVYLTEAQMHEEPLARHCHTEPDEHRLHVWNVGYLRGWTELFDAYKALRNEIVKLRQNDQ